MAERLARWDRPRLGAVTFRLLLALLLAPAALFAAPVKSLYPMEVVAEGLREPRGLLFLPDGSLLVAEQAGNTIARVAPEGTLTRIVAGLSWPHDIARDGAGALYVADTGKGRVALVSPDGAVSTYVAGLTAPVDLDFDPAGRLIICEYIRGPLKVAEGPGNAKPFGPVLDGGHGLLFEPGGGIVVVENLGERISRLAGDGQLEPAWRDIRGVGLARGLSGDVYVAEPAAGRVWRLKPGGVEVVVAEGLAGPRDPAFDPAGRLYVAETGAGRVVRFTGAF
ncbi:MAG: NHL repeat-containing protein [Gemmatimonadetes bacterium]|nr:NHL repeat-containing protein [Gemmatimonadota bacterium]